MFEASREEKKKEKNGRERGKEKSHIPSGICIGEGISSSNEYNPASRTNRHAEELVLFCLHHERARFHEHATSEQFVSVFEFTENMELTLTVHDDVDDKEASAKRTT